MTAEATIVMELPPSEDGLANPVLGPFGRKIEHKIVDVGFIPEESS